MNIPAGFEEYFQLIDEGNNIELNDAQTKIIIKAEHDCYRIIGLLDV